MGHKILVVKAAPLLALGALAGKVATATGARALATGTANLARGAAGAAKEVGQKVAQSSVGQKVGAVTEKLGDKKVQAGLVATQMAQQKKQHEQQMEQQRKTDQQNRSMQMAEKAKVGAGTMQKQLQGVLDDLRLLKGTLQLPSALSEELRDSIKTLDRNHEIVNGKDETLVHNTTPFTEDIIRRLAETEDEKMEEPLFQPQQLFY
tara:strand:- start:24 stop:641 length:618 start_codon:yes stop_codon:yes gene_type:complete